MYKVARRVARPMWTGEGGGSGGGGALTASVM